MESELVILNPGVPGIASLQKRHVLNGLEGKVVGFIDNSKPNFNHLVEDIAALLVKQYGVKETIIHRKRLASISASEEQMKDVELQCDLVITGSGD